jgi:hypothetical protein
MFLIVLTVGLLKLVEGKLDSGKRFAPIIFQYSSITDDIVLSKFTNNISANFASCVYFTYILLNFIYNTRNHIFE